MAGKSRKRLPKATAPEKNVRAAILEGVAILYDRHCGEIKKIREDSEQQIINVAFPIQINGSEAELTVKTQIRFSEQHTDSITARLDDPNQGKFEFLDPENPAPPKEGESNDAPRKRGRPRKTGDGDTVAIAAAAAGETGES